MGGTYTLLVTLPERVTLTVGALGERTLSPGTYAYVGSALGSGGFARVERHRRLARGDHEARHWHVDYLLGHPTTAIDGVVTSEAAIECAVARDLADRLTPVSGVGCSDCDCGSHLFGGGAVEAVRETVEGAHERAVSRT